MTAVEWLVQRMKHICKWDEYMLLENLGHIDKAKELEKEQIIDAYSNGANDEFEHWMNNEDRITSVGYYKRAYNK